LRGFLIGAAILLAGCEGGFLQPPSQAVVARGAVTIAGPAGYCVDRTAGRDNSQGAFVLLGSCASIGNNAGFATPRVAGALTASVSVESGANIGDELGRLGAFFRSAQGREALARDGEANSVTMLSASTHQDVLFMKVRDTSSNPMNGLAQDYWRALFDLRGRIVTLSVNSFQGKPMSGDDGFTTLAEFVARVRAQNPALVDEAADPV
jgi:hypothetical protein